MQGIAPAQYLYALCVREGRGTPSVDEDVNRFLTAASLNDYEKASSAPFGSVDYDVSENGLCELFLKVLSLRLDNSCNDVCKSIAAKSNEDADTGYGYVSFFSGLREFCDLGLFGVPGKGAYRNSDIADYFLAADQAGFKKARFFHILGSCSTSDAADDGYAYYLLKEETVESDDLFVHFVYALSLARGLGGKPQPDEAARLLMDIEREFPEAHEYLERINCNIVRLPETPVRPDEDEVEWPEPVADLKLSRSPDGISIECILPATGEPVFFMTSKEPLLDSDRCNTTKFSELVRLFGTPLELDFRKVGKISKACCKRKTIQSGVCYILPCVKIGDRYTFSKPEPYCNNEPFRNLEVQRYDDYVWATWTWTGKDSKALVLSKLGEFPSDPDDKRFVQAEMTRLKYASKRGLEIKRYFSIPSCVEIYQKFEISGQTFYSEPLRLCSELFWIQYGRKLGAKKGGVRPDCLWIKMKEPKSRLPEFVHIPELIMVRQLGRPPLNRADGEVIATIPEVSEHETQFLLDERLYETKGGYFRLFCANPDDRFIYGVLDPEQKELALRRFEPENEKGDKKGVGLLSKLPFWGRKDGK